MKNIQSMTGYGQASSTIESQTVQFEIKGVNHRYLETRFRLPAFLNSFESVLKEKIQQKIKRGRVEINCNWDENKEDNSSFSLDWDKIAKLERWHSEIQKKTSLPLQPFHLLELISFFESKQNSFHLQTNENIEAELLILFSEAIENFCLSKNNEGLQLQNHLKQLLDSLRQCYSEIKELAHQEPKQMYEKLHQRFADFEKDYSIDKIDSTRLHQELAILVDRIDVSEEIARINSHLKQFSSCMNSSEEVGRKLDFICQELQREFNTLSSKTQSASISQLVIEAKTQINKLREQVQNIE